MAIQEQAVSTNFKKFNIILSYQFLLCHCHVEYVDYLLSSCSFLAQIHCKQWHDKVAAFIHWHLQELLAFMCVLIGGNIIQTWCCAHSHARYCGINITVVFPNDQKLDIAIARDSRLSSKVLEKQTRYSDLRIEPEKL